MLLEELVVFLSVGTMELIKERRLQQSLQATIQFINNLMKELLGNKVLQLRKSIILKWMFRWSNTVLQRKSFLLISCTVMLEDLSQRLPHRKWSLEDLQHLEELSSIWEKGQDLPPLLKYIMLLVVPVLLALEITQGMNLQNLRIKLLSTHLKRNRLLQK